MGSYGQKERTIMEMEAKKKVPTKVPIHHRCQLHRELGKRDVHHTFPTGREQSLPPGERKFFCQWLLNACVGLTPHLFQKNNYMIDVNFID
ncbi:hypothetical protein AVEN_139378-1 [Araneus ventricosus]|uniref:Uncharacterized protein n=1 Tax=Araneus ventricosus TaxID=182803 RepID=A0A4Y2EED4_ARAVE|nr:hypothetical protein AVEN_139378-1 [Araneus ventricosus]